MGKIGKVIIEIEIDKTSPLAEIWCSCTPGFVEHEALKMIRSLTEIKDGFDKDFGFGRTVKILLK